MITHEAYQQIGGAVGALANRADEIYGSFTDEAQRLAHQMFMRLATLGEGAEDTRRRTEQIELLSLTDNTDLMEEIIDQFAAYRLLSLDHDPQTRQPTVEVAHEAILREWDRLRMWLNASRDDIRQERAVSRAADDWDTHRRDASYLLHGARLEQVNKWRQTTELSLTPLEQDFITHSLTQREKEEQAEIERKGRENRLEQRSRNFLRGLVGVFAIATLLSAALSIFAFTQRNRAEDNADYARSVALASAAQSAALSNNPDQAIAYAVAAYDSTDYSIPFVQSVLYDTAIRPATRRVFRGEASRVNIFSPDERSVLSWNNTDSSIIVWDVESGQVIRRLPELRTDRQ
jgi:hypothetical protein